MSTQKDMEKTYHQLKKLHKGLKSIVGKTEALSEVAKAADAAAKHSALHSDTMTQTEYFSVPKRYMDSLMIALDTMKKKNEKKTSKKNSSPKKTDITPDK